jgi:hypothetical protein
VSCLYGWCCQHGTELCKDVERPVLNSSSVEMEFSGDDINSDPWLISFLGTGILFDISRHGPEWTILRGTSTLILLGNSN